VDAARYRGAAATSLINAQRSRLRSLRSTRSRLGSLPCKEAQELAQQHSERGIRQLYWRLKAAPAGPESPRHEA